ncbi:MAG: hypothetical protein JWM27_1889 [Gemmatimonadetes bacterium]|nr:hypothetical protein [Gemmatimonadota bacterium]
MGKVRRGHAAADPGTAIPIDTCTCADAGCPAARDCRCTKPVGDWMLRYDAPARTCVPGRTRPNGENDAEDTPGPGCAGRGVVHGGRHAGGTRHGARLRVAVLGGLLTLGHVCRRGLALRPHGAELRGHLLRGDVRPGVRRRRRRRRQPSGTGRAVQRHLLRPARALTPHLRWDRQPGGAACRLPPVSVGQTPVVEAASMVDATPLNSAVRIACGGRHPRCPSPIADPCTSASQPAFRWRTRDSHARHPSRDSRPHLVDPLQRLRAALHLRHAPGGGERADGEQRDSPEHHVQALG